ncbi:hypothetical protein XELAEV_18010019mg [Xenopus laevis]|uniref:Uncharacterized protein n=1 Tax=Xenopus laevis TaxID=8355 RepID=A0A974I1A3_XENLA|nr:hypothetical protein XELAEV_18010019mg [Xenopus laevis]
MLAAPSVATAKCSCRLGDSGASSPDPPFPAFYSLMIQISVQPAAGFCTRKADQLLYSRDPLIQFPLHQLLPIYFPMAPHCASSPQQQQQRKKDASRTPAQPDPCQ